MTPRGTWLVCHTRGPSLLLYHCSQETTPQWVARSWEADTCRGPGASPVPASPLEPAGRWLCPLLFLLSPFLTIIFPILLLFLLCPLLCFPVLFLYSCVPSSSGSHHQPLPIAHALGTIHMFHHGFLSLHPWTRHSQPRGQGLMLGPSGESPCLRTGNRSLYYQTAKTGSLPGNGCPPWRFLCRIRA